MAEELTTEMHFEFLEDMGTDRLSYFVFAARGAMNRGLSKVEALKRYGLSEAVYDAEIDRVMSTDDWWGGETASEKKETIFDFNPTDFELLRFGGRDALDWAVARGIYDVDDNRYYHLGLLFSGRGDKERASYYFSKIEDEKILHTLVQDF